MDPLPQNWLIKSFRKLKTHRKERHQNRSSRGSQIATANALLSATLHPPPRGPGGLQRAVSSHLPSLKHVFVSSLSSSSSQTKAHSASSEISSGSGESTGCQIFSEDIQVKYCNVAYPKGQGGYSPVSLQHPILEYSHFWSPQAFLFVCPETSLARSQEVTRKTSIYFQGLASVLVRFTGLGPLLFPKEGPCH